MFTARYMSCTEVTLSKLSLSESAIVQQELKYVNTLEIRFMLARGVYRLHNDGNTLSFTSSATEPTLMELFTFVTKALQFN